MQPRYRVGDRVRIIPPGRLGQSLDASDRTDGCFLMAPMRNFCGHEFKVLKVVEHVFDERRLKMYGTRSPLYILEGVICDGAVPSFAHRCDRSCYLLWHEAWLERVEE